MNAPTPFDLAPPADYPRRNVVYLRPHRMAQAEIDRGMLAATDDRPDLAEQLRGDSDTAYANAIHEMIGGPVRLVVAVAFVYALLLAAMVVLA